MAKFKKELFSIFQSVKSSTYCVFDIPGIVLLTRFIVPFNDLYKRCFRHAFDCFTPGCICGLASWDIKHFFLHCPHYHTLHVNLFRQISDSPGIDLTYFHESSLCNLLYRNLSSTQIHNSVIIGSTIAYINATGRLDLE